MSGQAVPAADRLREKGMFVNVMQFYRKVIQSFDHGRIGWMQPWRVGSGPLGLR